MIKVSLFIVQIILLAIQIGACVKISWNDRHYKNTPDWVYFLGEGVAIPVILIAIISNLL